MYCNALSIEYYVAKPQPGLGDMQMSPLFNRVSAACPVLSIFGYIRIPALDDDFLHLEAARDDKGPNNEGRPPEGRGFTRDGGAGLAQALSSPELPPLSSSLRVSHPPPRGAAAGVEGPLSTTKSPFPARPTVSVSGTTRTSTSLTFTAPPTSFKPASASEEGEGKGGSATADQAGVPSVPATRGRDTVSTGKRRRSAEVVDPRIEPEPAPRQWSACVHVHGYYPYFLVPQYDRAVSAVQFGAQLETVALRVLFLKGGGGGGGGGQAGGGLSAASAQNRAAFLAAERMGTDAAQAAEQRSSESPLRQAPSHGQLLHDVQIVEKLPFYGYHAHPYPFYKVSVIDPGHVKAMVDLLQETTEVGGRSWQPYEAHCAYHSQFMIDLDIKGMSTFLLPRGHVRTPVQGRLRGHAQEGQNRGKRVDDKELENVLRTDMLGCGVASLQAPDEGEGRRTYATLEVDISAAALEEAMLLEASRQGNDATATRAAATTAGGPPDHPRRSVEPGSHLTHVRALVKRYFAECGVPDRLRKASTISTELRTNAAWQRGVDVGEAGFCPRYGSVTVIQRCDPVALSLRRQLLTFVRARLAAVAAATTGGDPYGVKREGATGTITGLLKTELGTDTKPVDVPSRTPFTRQPAGTRQAQLPGVTVKEAPPPPWYNPAWAGVRLPAYLPATQDAPERDRSRDEVVCVGSDAAQETQSQSVSSGNHPPLTFEMLEVLRGSQGSAAGVDPATAAAALADWSSNSSCTASAGPAEASPHAGLSEAHTASAPTESLVDGEQDGLGGIKARIPFSVGDCVAWLLDTTYHVAEGREAEEARHVDCSHHHRVLLRYATARVLAFPTPGTVRLQWLCGIADGTHYAEEDAQTWVRQRRWAAPVGRVVFPPPARENSPASWTDPHVLFLGELLLVQGAVQDVPVTALWCDVASRAPVSLSPEQLATCNASIGSVLGEERGTALHISLDHVTALPPTLVLVERTVEALKMRAAAQPSPGEGQRGSGAPNALTEGLSIRTVLALCRYAYHPYQRRMMPTLDPFMTSTHDAALSLRRSSSAFSQHKGVGKHTSHAKLPELLQTESRADLKEMEPSRRTFPFSLDGSDVREGDDDRGDEDEAISTTNSDWSEDHSSSSSVSTGSEAATDTDASDGSRQETCRVVVGGGSEEKNVMHENLRVASECVGAIVSVLSAVAASRSSQADPIPLPLVELPATVCAGALEAFASQSPWPVSVTESPQDSESLNGGGPPPLCSSQRPRGRPSRVVSRAVEQQQFALTQMGEALMGRPSVHLGGNASEKKSIFSCHTRGEAQESPGAQDNERVRTSGVEVEEGQTSVASLSADRTEAADSPQKPLSLPSDQPLFTSSEPTSSGSSQPAHVVDMTGPSSLCSQSPPSALRVTATAVKAAMTLGHSPVTVDSVSVEDLFEGVGGIAGDGEEEEDWERGRRATKGKRDAERDPDITVVSPPRSPVGTRPVLTTGCTRASRCGADVDGLPRSFWVGSATTINTGPGIHGSSRSGGHSTAVLRVLPAEPEDGGPRVLTAVAGEATGRHESAALAPPPPLPKSMEKTHEPPPPPPLSSFPVSGSRSRRPRSASVSQLQFRITPFRVMYVEVILDRTPGASEVAQDAVLAVALGSTTTEAYTMSVQLICVTSSPRTPAITPVPGYGGRVRQVEVPSERDLLRCVVRTLLAADPDIIVSWEGFKYGLGFLALRYRVVMQRDLARDLSRFHTPGNPTEAAPTAPLRGPGGAVGVTDRKGNASAEAGRLQEGSAALGKASWVLGIENILRAMPNAGDERGGAVPSREGEKEPLSLPANPDVAVEEEEEEEDEDPAEGIDEDDGDGDKAVGTGGSLLAQRYAKRFGAAVRIAGRVCRSLGKDLRKQVKAPSYTLAMMHQQVLGETFPYFTDVALAQLFSGARDTRGDCECDPCADRLLAVNYLVRCCVGAHRIARAVRYYLTAAEFSAMYGILFDEVLSRGSQFRVEATLLRMARPLNYAMLSPSRLQVFQQPRIQCIPLVMQPKSGFYGGDDPILVLDFRSLYPSVAIAYNLCYSTCVGLVQANTHGRLGVVTRYKQPNALLARRLEEEEVAGDGADGAVIVAPNGAVFLPSSVRQGVLPRMLQTVLDTRFEVQAAIKHVAGPLGDAAMQARLGERQQALKMLANVTYGYTAASFTGRMPCVDVAEAIVSLGRQTLERAIALIHGTARWGAEVVYGDTDSVFVRVGKGRTLSEAFRIGAEIAQAVTASNPVPIQLQFEKVLCPCLLVVKKRYAGYAWFRADQTTPEFLDKGIETVRRDQCPATARITRALLTNLFESALHGTDTDIHSAAWRATLRAQYYTLVGPLVRGEGNPCDFIFRRAVKLGRYSDASTLPLAARLALKRMERDLLATPHWGERLPYLVVQSLSSSRLRDQVVHPEAALFLGAPPAVLDAEYYLKRHINAALDRLFYLVGVSFAAWQRTTPRTHRNRHVSLQTLSAPPLSLVMAPAMTMRLQGLLAWLRAHDDWRGEARPALRSTTAPWLRERETHPDSTADDAAAANASAAIIDIDAEQHVPEAIDSCSTARDRKRGRALAGVTVDVDSEDAEGAEEAEEPCGPRKRTGGAKAPKRELKDGGRGRTAAPGQGLPRRAKATLEDYYPTVLCCVCQHNTVSPAEQAAPLAHCLQRRGPRLPPPAMDSPSLTLPPICTACASDPQALLCCLTEHVRGIGHQLHRLQHHCRDCMMGAWGGVDGGVLRRPAPVDLEDLVGREHVWHDGTAAGGGMPLTRAAAVGITTALPLLSDRTRTPREGEDVAHWAPPVMENALGCASCECALNYDKRRLTLLFRQMQLLKGYVEQVLSE